MAPPKRPWFRFYVETFTDVEVRALPPAQRWVWAAVLGIARTSPVSGVLLDKAGDPVPDVVIADVAAVKLADVKAAIRRFLALGSLARDERHALVVQKWDARQYESDDVATRVAKHRASKESGVDVTPDAPPDVTANGGGDVTADTPDHVTESPSVVLPEVHRTEPLTSSSSEPVSVPKAAEEDDLARQVWTLLAQHDADEFIRSGGTIKSRNWFVAAAENRRMTCGSVFADLRLEHPDWAAERFVEALTRPAVKATPEDATLAAQLARMQITQRRRTGDVCPRCDDRGVVELDDGTFDDCSCKSVRSAS